MTISARVYEFPGSFDGSGERPATYGEYLVSIGLSDQTIRNYTMRLASAERALAKIGATVLTAKAGQLAHIANQTANSHALRGQLRCALKHYYEWQDRMDAPLRAVRVPPQPHMVCKALEPDEAKRLAAAAVRVGWNHGTVVLLGLFLGLRRFEIAKAEWERFDDRMEWYTVQGKRDKTATIPVHPALTKHLEPHRRERGYLFPGRTNVRKFISVATVALWTTHIYEIAGLEPRPPHVLHHLAGEVPTAAN